jgi:3-deoxy-D-manno-octulosonate 8-phosphate phosphatase (KDO 8-P phosphatase)
MASYSVQERAKQIRLLVLDVDGILSDGRLTFTNSGEELKAFDVQDGFGIKCIQDAGIIVGVITGRSSHIVQNRMQSLGIAHVIQGREDKGVALRTLCQELGIDLLETAYMGDDWPDLTALGLVGLALTAPNAHAEVRKRAHFVTQNRGGQGAVREVCDLLLQSQGHYDDLLTQYTRSFVRNYNSHSKLAHSKSKS